MFTLRVETKDTWILVEKLNGMLVGGVRYRHCREGNHYQPWIVREGDRQDVGLPVPQLGMAARIAENESAK